jgi:FkbM family methyltransferase
MSFLDRLLKRTPPPAAEDRATELDICYAYRLVLRRDPDPEGLAHWRNLVSQGITLHRLIRGFFNSDEYRFLYRAESQPTPVDMGGYQVCVQKLDTDFGQAILDTREYEPQVRQAVREYVRAGDVVVDVGANVGCIAFLAAAIAGPTGRVIAIEPNPDNVQMLYRGVLLNGFEHVDVLPYAASNRRAVLALTGGTSNTHVISPRAVGTDGYCVQSIVLDETLAWLPRLDLVKIDIEGYEPLALEGFAKSIERWRPTLLTEFNPRCLVDFHQQDPLAYLRQIFALYPRVQAIGPVGPEGEFDGADALMRHWERRNREVAAEGRLPDRMLHFDLIGIGH